MSQPIWPKVITDSIADVRAQLAAKDSEIAALRADWRKRGEALEPFAAMADQVDEWQKGTGQFTGSFDANDLRRARAALAPKP